MSKIIGNTVGTPISPKKVVEKADIKIPDADNKTIQMVNVEEYDTHKPIWTWDSGIYQLFSDGGYIELDYSSKYIVSDGMIIIADVPSFELKAIYSFCFDNANYEQNIVAILVDSEGNISSDMSAGLFINERIMALESAIAELALMGD